MEDLEKALVLSAIHEGAGNPSNKGFSTKKIAENCGVSEFTLFTKFKTKENLVSAALDSIESGFAAEAKKAAGSSRDVSDYVTRLIYFGFSHPEEMIFLANYGFWDGEAGADTRSLLKEKDRSIRYARSVFAFNPGLSDTAILLCWAYLIRHLDYFVEGVYNGLFADSPAHRLECGRLLAKGLAPYLAKEAR